MLGNVSRFVSPELERLLKQMLAEENAYKEEMRSQTREKIVFPVKLTSPDDEFESYAFSRDISSDGIGLIAQLPFYPDDNMLMELNVPGHSKEYLATCRWSNQFGATFWISGWSLTQDKFDVTSIRQLDAKMEWEARSAEREKFAIPVVIHQKGQQPKIQSFTRNLSGDGTNLVSKVEVQVSSFCKLEFVPNKGERCEVTAKCVWAHKYGDDYWLSGWQFSKEQ